MGLLWCSESTCSARYASIDFVDIATSDARGTPVSDHDVTLIFDGSLIQLRPVWIKHGSFVYPPTFSGIVCLSLLLSLSAMIMARFP